MAYAHIAACVDDSPGSLVALAEAVRLRAASPGTLSVVHVLPPPEPGAGNAGPDEDPRGGPSLWLREISAATGVAGARPVLLDGYAPVAVCQWARRSEADLIVAGAHRGVLTRLRLGSVAAYLAHHAPCSALLVPPLPRTA